jgi:hypothetical protein
VQRAVLLLQHEQIPDDEWLAAPLGDVQEMHGAGSVARGDRVDGPRPALEAAAARQRATLSPPSLVFGDSPHPGTNPDRPGTGPASCRRGHLVRRLTIQKYAIKVGELIAATTHHCWKDQRSVSASGNQSGPRKLRRLALVRVRTVATTRALSHFDRREDIFTFRLLVGADGYVRYGHHPPKFLPSHS